MKHLPYFSVCIALCLVPVSRSFAEEKVCTVEGEFGAYIDADAKPFSRSEREQLLDKFDFSPLFAYRLFGGYIAYVGDGYRRMSFSIHAARKISPTKYQFSGELNGQLYRGELHVKEVKRVVYKSEPDALKKHVRSRGVVTSELRLFNADRDPPVVTGNFLTMYYINADDELVYDDWDSINDDWRNNQFVGMCTLADQGKTQKCAWGHSRVSCSGDLDVGAGEFHPNEKYQDNGWQDWGKHMPVFQPGKAIGHYQSNTCGMNVTLLENGQYVLTGNGMEPLHGTYKIKPDEHVESPYGTLSLARQGANAIDLSIGNEQMGIWNIDLEEEGLPAILPFCHVKWIQFWKVPYSKVISNPPGM